MQKIVFTTLLSLILSFVVKAQEDFPTLNKLSYDLFNQNEYKKHQDVARKMISNGMDFYYLRMRMGILAFNREKYGEALPDFEKALEMNGGDTLVTGYILKCYTYSGRQADARLYIRDHIDPPYSERYKQQTGSRTSLRAAISYQGFSNPELVMPDGFTEIIDRSKSVSVGVKQQLGSALQLDLGYTLYNKKGTNYSGGASDFSMSQHQIYTGLSWAFARGWEAGGHLHTLFFPVTPATGSNKSSRTEATGGLSIKQSGWYHRLLLQGSASNFGYSTQKRADASFTWFPGGNLNLYFSVGAMIQTDRKWGESYELNQEIGFRMTKKLWLEAGAKEGNSFLSSRNSGTLTNNSFQIPALTGYANLICPVSPTLLLTFTPYLIKYENNSWNFYTFEKSYLNNSLSGGCTLKMEYHF